jgi:superfamily I DNA and/or RNA helicase
MQVKLYGFLMKREGLNSTHVKIMSQYRAQTFAIQEALKQKDFDDAEVNTVVGSQGKWI